MFYKTSCASQTPAFTKDMGVQSVVSTKLFGNKNAKILFWLETTPSSAKTLRCVITFSGSGDKLLVEASPYDQVWGVGLQANDPAIRDQSSWRGLNLLGKALQKVRHALRFRLPPPTRSTRLASFEMPTASPPTRGAVYEVHPATHHRLPLAVSHLRKIMLRHFLNMSTTPLPTMTTAFGQYLLINTLSAQFRLLSRRTRPMFLRIMMLRYGLWFLRMTQPLQFNLGFPSKDRA